MNIFEPVNDPIQSHSQLSSYIKLPEFEELVRSDQISTVQVFYESVAQEIYNARKKNYSWGFGVIEPQIINFCDRMILVSKLYKEEHLADLNSVIFKLFAEFNNIILSSALHMHLPVQGIIQIGQVYQGSVRSRKPALVSGKDPLILSDLLKVFSFGEIFPNGYTDGMIPAVEMPYHFGIQLCESIDQVTKLDSVGIFLPASHASESLTEVTILSNILAEVEIAGQKIYACNWREWMSGQSDCSPDNILAFAESEGRGKGPHASKWRSLADYSIDL